MRVLFCLICLVLAFLHCGRAAAEQPGRPNILFLFSDDQRADTISAYGNALIQTPNLDRLARAGFNFRNAYCFGSIHGAVCQPSRAMLHSGRTLYRVPMDLKDVQTLGQVLGDAGYETFGTGKWHNGKESFERSFQRGRSIMFGGMSDHSRVPVCDLMDTRKFTSKEQSDVFSSELFSSSAIEFLSSRDEQRPFFCYVSYTSPHDPRMPPGRYAEMYQPEDMMLPQNFLPQHPFNTGQLTIRDEKLAAWPRTETVIKQQTAEYYGMITHMDHQIGRIINQLEESGLLADTMIIFSSDHGLGMGSHGLLGKQNLYEHSMKSPMIISGPGIRSGSSDALVYLHDLYATVCSIARVPVPEQTEAVDLMSIVTGRHSLVRSSLFTAYAKWIRAVRDERWKLIRWPQINKTQLFDLACDPHELNDLASDPQHKNMVSQMTALLADWQSRVGDQQSLTVDEPIAAEIDLTGRKRKPDNWQPEWIVEKYFSPGK